MPVRRGEAGTPAGAGIPAQTGAPAKAAAPAETESPAGGGLGGPAGYSGTPLPRKLGIKPGAAVALVAAPPGFADVLEPLPDGVRLEHGLNDGGPFDVIVFFTVQRVELADQLAALRAAMTPAAGLWVAWPKRASKVPTDMTDDAVREIALPTGLVDNKVCAIDTIWTGQRLVIRRELRRP
jgi:hypothetical protein